MFKEDKIKMNMIIFEMNNSINSSFSKKIVWKLFFFKNRIERKKEKEKEPLPFFPLGDILIESRLKSFRTSHKK